MHRADCRRADSSPDRGGFPGPRSSAILHPCSRASDLLSLDYYPGGGAGVRQPVQWEAASGPVPVWRSHGTQSRQLRPGAASAAGRTGLGGACSAAPPQAPSLHPCGPDLSPRIPGWAVCRKFRMRVLHAQPSYKLVPTAPCRTRTPSVLPSPTWPGWTASSAAYTARQTASRWAGERSGPVSPNARRRRRLRRRRRAKRAHRRLAH